MRSVCARVISSSPVTEGEFEIHKKAEQDEFEQYKANTQKEFIEYKREFGLEANRMASFDGKRVVDSPLSGETKKIWNRSKPMLGNG